jgi:hypothetical protein
VTRPRAADLVVFLGPSLAAGAARAIAPCRVLPPARAGDVLAVLPERPLAIALVDGLFDTTPSVWHHELLAALDAGVAVFGGASMGALRAAELWRAGVVGVGGIFQAYRDGTLDDDAEVALLHADAEHAFRPLTVPLVTVRAAAAAARAARHLTSRQAAALVATAGAMHYTARTWPALLAAAPLHDGARTRLRAFLPDAPDPKADDARACIAAAAEAVRARRSGAPAVPAPRRSVPSHVRRARLLHARSVVPSGAVASGEVVAALARREDAGRLAADGLRRALLAALARSLGYAARDGEADAALRSWLARAGVSPRSRDAFLAACGLDAGAASSLGEELALEARLLSEAARVVPDGPSWEEGLALGARLTGAWVEEAERLAREAGPESGSRSGSGSGSRSPSGSRSRSKSKSKSKSR